MVCISKNRALTVLAGKFNLPLDNIPVDKLLNSLLPKIRFKMSMFIAKQTDHQN